MREVVCRSPGHRDCYPFRVPRLFTGARLAAVGVATAAVTLTVITLYARAPQREHSHWLRAMTINAHAGVDARGRYDLPRLAHAIADAQPSIVGVQELTRNHAAYGCDDQPALLATLLRQITGRPWTQVYVNEWVTTHRDCMNSGRGDGVETEGLALLAPEPLRSVDVVRLWNTRIGLSARLGSEPGVSIVVTHLAAGTDGHRDRMRQIEALLPWADGRGGARIFLGDFNATPDSPEMQRVLARYHDAWHDASAEGVASGSGATHKAWRIDYVLYAPGNALQIEHVDVPSTATLLRPEVSDHHPVVADFRILM